MLPLLFNGQIPLFLLIVVALIVSLTFHEYGHAWAAKRYGDDTAEREGRLTLDPTAHIDPLGLLMVVLIGFGYAKPVPTDPRNFNSRWAQLGVAAAGPLANLLIAVVVWNFYRYGVQSGWQSFLTPGGATFFRLLVGLNLLLMVFNLLPIGPLDGHYILPYFLPRQLARRYVELNAQYGSLFFLGLVGLSIAGLPIFSFVFKTAMGLLPYITFV